MPEEYYGYVKREQDNLIDWSKAGKDLTTVFQQEAERRDKQKSEIEASTDKALNELANAPKGEAEDGNRFVTDYSDDATQSILLANRLLKSGKMSVKDYTLFMANVNSGTTQLFSLQKEYQKWFDIKKQRMNSTDPKNKSQAIEVDSNGWMEAFGDFSKSRAIIDPATGQVSAAITKVGENGDRELTENIRTVQSLQKSLGHKYDYFPSAQAAEVMAKRVAPVIITNIEAGSIDKKGQINTYKDPLQRIAIKEGAIKESATQKALDDGIRSFLNVPTNVTSILTDDIGTFYNVRTEEEHKKDPVNSILWKEDSTGLMAPVLTDEQKKRAFEYLKTQTEAMISQEVDRTVFSPQAIEARELKLRERGLAVQERNAATAEANSRSRGDGGGGGQDDDEGNTWVDYVSLRVPEMSLHKMADENAIATLTKNFQGLGLTFEQEPGTKRESIVVVNNSFDPPERYVIAIKDNPNARQDMIDLIARVKVKKGKDMISTGIIKKKSKKSQGSVTEDKQVIPGF